MKNILKLLSIFIAISTFTLYANSSPKKITIEVETICKNNTPDKYPERLELFSCQINLQKLPKTFQKSSNQLSFSVQKMPKQKNSKTFPAVFKAISSHSGIVYWKAQNTDTKSLWTISISSSPPPQYPPLLGFGDKLYMHKIGSIHRSESQKLNLADWDNDGKLDIIMGNYSDGVLFFKNNGGEKISEMRFDQNNIYKLQDNKGKKIINHGIGVSFSSPTIGDINGDGILDFVLGSRWKRQIQVFTNIGSRENAKLKLTACIKKRGMPEVGDWNGDGKNDIIFCPLDKVFRLFVLLNTGKKGTRWSKPTEVFCDTSLNCEKSRHFSPIVTYADLNKDGLKDLIVTVRAGTYFYKNTGTKQCPKFAPKINMRKHGVPGMNLCGLAVIDWNNDGKNDLVSAYGRLYINKGTNNKMKFAYQPEAFKCSSPKLLDIKMLYSFICKKNPGGKSDSIISVTNSKLSFYKNTVEGFVPGGKSLKISDYYNDAAGCPDKGEYNCLYERANYADLNGDKIKDLIITDEHSWRYGFIRYFQGEGNWKFAPQKRLALYNLKNWANFVPGFNKQALQLTPETYADYLSYPSSEFITPAAGKIEFYFSPQKEISSNGCILFSSSSLKTSKKLPAPFILQITPQKKLEFSSSTFKITTQKAIILNPGKWYLFSCSWNSTKVEASVCQSITKQTTTITATGKFKTPFMGSRFYIGNLFRPGIQKEREVNTRTPAKYPDCAIGLFDDFKIYNASQELALYLPFDNSTADIQQRFANRMPIGYRCAPCVADLNGDGLPDLILMIADGKRGYEGNYDYSKKFKNTQGGKGKLMAFINCGTREKPAFRKGEQLYLANNQPFKSHYRTQVMYYDWDNDGRKDLLLGSEKIKNRKNQLNESITFFKNTGKIKNGLPVFKNYGQFSALKQSFSHHHEPDIQIIDWDKDGWLDIITNSDHGKMQLFSHSQICPKYMQAKILKYNYSLNQ